MYIPPDIDFPNTFLGRISQHSQHTRDGQLTDIIIWLHPIALFIISKALATLLKITYKAGFELRPYILN